VVATHEIGLVERFGERRLRLEAGRLVENAPASAARA